MQPATQYLAMLERLVVLKHQYADVLNDVGVRLMDRAIDAVLKECEDAGLADQAQAILAEC